MKGKEKEKRSLKGVYKHSQQTDYSFSFKISIAQGPCQNTSSTEFKLENLCIKESLSPLLPILTAIIF